VSINWVHDITEAQILDGSNVSSGVGHDINLTATENQSDAGLLKTLFSTISANSTINVDLADQLVALLPPHLSTVAIALGGAGAGAGGSTGGVSGAIGGALAVNVIGNAAGDVLSFIGAPPSSDVLGNLIGSPPRPNVLANIDGSTVHSGGGIGLTVSSSANVLALAVGVAGAGSGGATGGVSLAGAGSGSVNLVDNIIEAAIRHGNQSGGNVTLMATDNSIVTALAGAGAGAGSGGATGGVDATLGLSVSANFVSNTAQALIDGATLSAQSVDLAAHSKPLILAASVAGGAAGAGGEAGGIALTGMGAFALNTVQDAVAAQITGGSTITTSGGSVTLAATDDAHVNALAGAGAGSGAGGQGGGGTAGVGGAAGFNDVENMVKANIDSSAVHSGGGVILSAVANPELLAAAIGVTGGGSGGQIGGVSLAGAGSAGINHVVNAVEASITHKSDVTSANGGSISLTATDNASITALAGAGAGAGAGGQVGGIAATLGLSAVINDVNDTAQAIIDRSHVASAASVDLNATSTARLRAATAAGAVAGSGGEGGGGSLAGVGAGAFNFVTDHITAQIRDGSSVSSAANKPITLTATDGAGMAALAGAGAAAVAGGAAGGGAEAFGGSVAINTINDTTTANIDSSRVASASDVRLNALSTVGVAAAAVGLSGDGAGGLAVGLALGGAVSGAANTLTDTVEASITHRGFSPANVSTGKARVVLTANDAPTVTAIAGAGDLAVGLGYGGGIAGGAGIAAALNSVTDSALAVIDGATVTGGSVTLNACAGDPSGAGGISAFAFGIAGAVSTGVLSVPVAGAGSIAQNDLANTVQATIGNSTVTTGGAVNVNATDDTQAAARAGSAAFTFSLGGNTLPLSLAASDAENHIDVPQNGSSVLAAIGSGAYVTGGGDVNLHALEAQSLLARAFAGSGTIGEGASGAQVALAGGEAQNDVGNNIAARIYGGSTVTSGTNHDLKVTATDASRISARVLGIALATGVGESTGPIALGGALAENDVANNTTASIDGSTATAGRNLVLSATADSVAPDNMTLPAETANVEALTVSVAGTVGLAGLALPVSAAGTLAKNHVANNIEASVKHGSTATATSGAITILAIDSWKVSATPGSVALVAGFGLEATGAAVGVAIALNDDGSQVNAFIDRSNVQSTGNLVVSATSKPTIDATGVGFTGGIGVGGSSATAIVGGAYSGNNIHTGSSATIIDSHSPYRAVSDHVVRAGGDLAITAVDLSMITTNADVGVIGADVGIAGGTLTIGLANATTTSSNMIHASIDGATVHASGVLSVNAHSGSTIKTEPIEVSVAAAVSGLGVAFNVGAVTATNTTTDVIEAFVRGGSDISAGGVVTVAAQDASSVDAAINAVALTLGDFGVANVSSVTQNTVTNTITACVENATVSGRGINVTADATQIDKATTDVTTEAFTLGGTAGQAVAISDIESNVDACVGNAILVAGLGAVNVSATSMLEADAEADAGGVALEALNVIEPTAKVGGSTRAHAEGAVTVKAAQFNVASNATYTTDAGASSITLSPFPLDLTLMTSAPQRATIADLDPGTVVHTGVFFGTVSVTAASNAITKAHARGIEGAFDLAQMLAAMFVEANLPFGLATPAPVTSADIGGAAVVGRTPNVSTTAHTTTAVTDYDDLDLVVASTHVALTLARDDTHFNRTSPSPMTTNDTSFSLTLDGDIKVLGADAHLHGMLKDDLTGQLSLTFDTGQPAFDFGGFQLLAGFYLDVSRAADGSPDVMICFNGAVTLPAWLVNTGVVPQDHRSVAASGCIDSAGDLNLKGLFDHALQLAQGLFITFAQQDADHPAFAMHLSTSGGPSGIELHGFVDVPLLSLQVDGELSSSGTGNLTVTMGTTADIGGVQFKGSGVLSFTPGAFQITLDGTATLPALFPGVGAPEVDASAIIDQNGIKEMDLGVRLQRDTRNDVPMYTVTDPTPPHTLLTFTVNSTRDDDLSPLSSQAKTPQGDITLRSAIQEANAFANNASYYTTTIILPAGTYLLTIPGHNEFAAATGDLDVVQGTNLVILGAGPGVTIIDAGSIDRAFDVQYGASLFLGGVTVQGGKAAQGFLDPGTGGAILNNGTLTLDHVVLTHNQAAFAGGALADGPGSTTVIANSTLSDNLAGASGGGISNAGTLTVSGSTIGDNKAGAEGGGISNTHSATVITTTLSGNKAPTAGGGIDNQDTLALDRSTLSGNVAVTGGGIHSGVLGNTTVTNSTISGNSASSGGGGLSQAFTVAGKVTLLRDTITQNVAPFAGGVAGQAFMGNTIVAGNTASFGPDVVGSFTTLGSNIIGDSTGGLNFNVPIGHDQLGDPVFGPINALLGPLQDNGGPTPTQVPLSGSPAIGKGTVAQSSTVDQRGVGRSFLFNTTVGAVEIPETTFQRPEQFPFGPLLINPNGSALLSLRRDGDGPDYKLHVDGKVSFGTLLSDAAVSGDLDIGTGDGTLDLSIGALTIGGFTIDGSFGITKSGNTTSLGVHGHISFLGHTLPVGGDFTAQHPATGVSLTFGTDGNLHGDLTVTVDSGGLQLTSDQNPATNLTPPPFAVKGAVGLEVGLASGDPFLTVNGNISVLGIDIPVDGKLDAKAIGSLAISLQKLALTDPGHPLASNDPGTALEGTFSLDSRYDTVTYFQGNVKHVASVHHVFLHVDPDFNLGGLPFNLPTFDIDGRGNFDVTTDEYTTSAGLGITSIPTPAGAVPIPYFVSPVELVFHSSGLHVHPDAPSSKFLLHLGGIGVTVVAPDGSRYSLPDVPAVDLDATSGNLRLVNGLASSFVPLNVPDYMRNLGIFKINGDLSLERNNRDWQLDVENTSIEIAGLPAIPLPDFSIGSGTFRVAAFDYSTAQNTFRLGGNGFWSLQNAAITLRRDADPLSINGALTSPYLEISGAAVSLPGLQNAFPLPDLHVRLDGTILTPGSHLNSLVLPSLPAGFGIGQLKIPSSAPFNLNVSGGALHWSLPRNQSVDCTLFDNGMTLTSFTADSNGNVSASVHGNLALGGYTLASGDFNLTGNGPNQLTLTTSGTLHVPLPDRLPDINVTVNGSLYLGPNDADNSFSFSYSDNNISVKLDQNGLTISKFTLSQDQTNALAELQNLVNSLSGLTSLTLQTDTPSVATAVIALIVALGDPGHDLDVTFNLGKDVIMTDLTIGQTNSHVHLHLVGGGSPPSPSDVGNAIVNTGHQVITTIIGHSPAFTMLEGDVTITNVLFITDTPAPTILIEGGSVKLRHDFIQESTGSAQAAIMVMGGNVDLGTTADSGGNILSVSGAGDFIRNNTSNAISASGTQFAANGAVAPSGDAVFVTQLYRDVLQRDADASEVGGWVKALLAGGTRGQVAQSFWESPEHRGLQVNHLYTNYLHRAADTGGFQFWTHALLTGTSEADMARVFLTSPEYLALHPDTASFVDGLYNDVLARPADLSGRLYWQQALQPGDRTSAAAAFLTSREAAMLAVSRDYDNLLGRPPDDFAKYFAQALAQGQLSADTVAETLLASDEYFMRSSRS
jgi:hypothetical protein